MTVNVTYREAGAVVPGATTIKNSPLSNGEIDGNFKSVKDAVEVLSTSSGAGLIGFTPVGNLSASNVQAALAELDNEKVGFARLDDTDGSSLVGYDGGTVQDVMDGAKSLQDYTALRAYTGRAKRIYITGLLVTAKPAGIAGFFQYDQTDTTSTDNGGTIIVGADGRRWKRQINDGVLLVDYFGVDNTGVISAVPAVNAIIAYANTLSGSVEIRFGSGSYNLRAGVTQKITKSNLSVIGENAIINSEFGKIFEFDSGAQMQRVAVKGFYFSYPSTVADVNATPISMLKCVYYDIDGVRVSYAPAVCYLFQCSNGTIDNIAGLTANVARNSLHYDSCSVTTTDNVYLITTAGLQPLNPATAYPNPPVAGNVFIRVTGQTNDTLIFKPGVLCNRYHRGFYATCDLTQVLLNLWIESCVFDYCYEKGIFIENLGSSVSGITISDPYVQAMSGVGIHIKTIGGQTSKVVITKPLVLFSGSHSIFVESNDPATCKNIEIHDPFIVGGNRLGFTGFDIYAIKSRVKLFGGTVGLNALSYTGLSLQALYGVYFDGCDEYTVTDVESGGLTGSYVFTNNPSINYRARSVHDNKVSRGNSVSTKPDYETTTLTSVVSGEVYTNTTPYKQYVSVYGTSTSGAATINVNDQQYSTRSEWSGILNPGDTLSVTTAISCNRRITRLP